MQPTGTGHSAQRHRSAFTHPHTIAAALLVLLSTTAMLALAVTSDGSGLAAPPARSDATPLPAVIPACGDLTGRHDFAAVTRIPGLNEQSPSIRITAQRDGTHWYDVPAPTHDESGFGVSAAFAGHAVGRLTPRFIVGSPAARGGHVYVYALTHRGAAERVAHVPESILVVPALHDGLTEFGSAVAPLFDQDGDGVDEIRIESLQTLENGDPNLITWIVDGVTGEPMAAFAGQASEHFWARIPGDVTNNGIVDVVDLHLIMANMGRVGEDLTAFDGDVNGDGRVDEADLLITIDHVGWDQFMYADALNEGGAASGGIGGSGTIGTDGDPAACDTDPCHPDCPTAPCDPACGGAPCSKHCPTRFCNPACADFDPCHENCDGVCNPDCGDYDPCDPSCGGTCNPSCADYNPCGTACNPVCSVTIEEPCTEPTVGSFIMIRAEVQCGNFSHWNVVGVPPVVVHSDLTDSVLVLELLGEANVTVEAHGQVGSTGSECSESFSFEIVDGPANDPIPEWCVDILTADPYNFEFVDICLDSDNDGLFDWEEICIYGTDPDNYDSDGDGLPDGWEIEHGLDPLNPEDAQQDWDGDGLTNFDEFIYGTDPNNWDSDGDGTSDGDEVAQCSDPNDPSDGSAPTSEDDRVYVTLTIGDQSGSHSEHWMLKAGQINFKAPGHGEVATETFCFQRGKSYDIEVIHLGTNCDQPDYDYTALVTLPPGECGWIDDPDNLLGIVNVGGGCGYGESPNLAIGKMATLHLPKIDLDIDSDNTNGYGLPDRNGAEDEIEDDPNLPGKIILVNSFDVDGDGIPDFADGFDHFGPAHADDDACAGAQFVPLILEISGFPFDGSGSIEFTYPASDPDMILATDSDPFVFPEGSLRLWTKPGHAPRNAEPIVKGGDYIPPGFHGFDVLGFTESTTTITLYVEAVRPSQTVAELQISTKMHLSVLQCPPDDSVRLTGTEVNLEARSYDSDEFAPVSALIGTAVDDPNAPPTPVGFTPGSFQIYRVHVADPRSDLDAVLLDANEFEFDGSIGDYVTTEFIALEPGIPPDAILPPWPSLELSDIRVNGSYNPTWTFNSHLQLAEPPSRDKLIAKLIKDAVEEMETEGWTPANPSDPGAFGKEAHARVAAKIAQDGDARWRTTVYVAGQNHPTQPFRKILAIGDSPPGGVAGTIEIDVICLKGDYNPQVGDLLDPDQVDDLYEIKTSAQGKIAPVQKTKLRAVRDGDIKIAMSKRKWTATSGWHDTPRITRIVKLVGLAGLATSAYAFINLDTYDDEIDDIIQQINLARTYTNPAEKRIEMVIAADQLNSYLSHFDPTMASDLVGLGMMYHVIGQDW